MMTPPADPAGRQRAARNLAHLYEQQLERATSLRARAVSAGDAPLVRHLDALRARLIGQRDDALAWGAGDAADTPDAEARHIA